MLRQRTWPSVLALPVLSATFPHFLVLAALFLACPAHAFDGSDREAVIGAFDLQPGSARPAQLHTPDHPEPARRAPADDDVLNLYEDAMEDLAAGARVSAQRLFERIVAQAPDSAVAARARRELAALYAPQSNSPAEPAAVGTSMRPASVREDTTPDWSAPSGVTRTPAPIAAPVPRASAGRLVSAEVEMQFVLDAGDRVFFSAGTEDLGARARGVLAAQARWLRSHPDVDVSIVGHSDDAPLSADQQAGLAQRRAQSVRQRLVDEGVDERRIFVTSVGRDEPVAECDRPECAAQNRRVVTQLSNRAPLRRPVGYVTAPR